MRNKRSWPIRPLFLLYLLLLAGVSGLSPGGSSAWSYDGRGRSLGGSWVTTGRADDFQAYCDANFAGTLCAEWCEGLDSQPTGVLCCVAPDALGFPGRETDCKQHLP